MLRGSFEPTQANVKLCDSGDVASVRCDGLVVTVLNTGEELRIDIYTPYSNMREVIKTDATRQLRLPLLPTPQQVEEN